MSDALISLVFHKELVRSREDVPRVAQRVVQETMSAMLLTNNELQSVQEGVQGTLRECLDARANWCQSDKRKFTLSHFPLHVTPTRLVEIIVGMAGELFDFAAWSSVSKEFDSSLHFSLG